MLIRIGIRSTENFDLSEEDCEDLSLVNAVELMRMPRIGKR